jgi:hypothetical protein
VEDCRAKGRDGVQEGEESFERMSERQAQKHDEKATQARSIYQVTFITGLKPLNRPSIYMSPRTLLSQTP